MISPAEWWWHSQRNPVAQERSESEALLWGRAFHALICEGRGAFEARYFRGPSKSDFEDLLVTIDDLKRWLLQRGFAQTGAKAELVKRVLSADASAPVWDRIVEQAEVLAQGREVLKPETYDEISISSKMITKNPHLAKAFTGGMPEVSVFWTRDGVRCKARFDYLKPRAVIDLKSFRNARDMPIDRAIMNTIAQRRYDVQAAHYIDAREQIAGFVESKKVFGDHSEAWLTKVVAAQQFTWVWVFYQAEGSPIARALQFNTDTRAFEMARQDVDAGLRSWRKYNEVFGDDIWVDANPVHVIADEEWPVWLGRAAA
ncbi:PD-(D/E)XK nuclease-like domain-containing protein [Chelatococcus asaccharovorans]|uniref:PD-(D/E)XK nuclease-like domain-containing protein n=1 Tax=Chelatococcus asaccharovorans TaxID=28210 RepID=UPI0014740135|nr:PD-(D/E)XK nuclease-like domain-containing protein [Chelatococcus asaccharovorans]MBS7703267.1 PD-(D/E)XK nuclease-like domain-containing protein [Chelatococcus asaccharovorans]